MGIVTNKFDVIWCNLTTPTQLDVPELRTAKHLYGLFEEATQSGRKKLKLEEENINDASRYLTKASRLFAQFGLCLMIGALYRNVSTNKLKQYMHALHLCEIKKFKSTYPNEVIRVNNVHW